MALAAQARLLESGLHGSDELESGAARSFQPLRPVRSEHLRISQPHHCRREQPDRRRGLSDQSPHALWEDSMYIMPSVPPGMDRDSGENLSADCRALPQEGLRLVK